MLILDQATKQAVQKVIDAHAAELKSIVGFVSAEPGFPIVDGAVLREPAILVFVAHKKAPDHLLTEERAPRQLGPWRVAVMQADPLRQLAAMSDHQDVAEALELASSDLTYQPIAGNPIDKAFKVAKPMLCHAGPDAGWPVLKPFLQATESTLSVAMYDFNADYIATTFINTVRGNDLKATLTWDDSMTAPETTIRGKLKDKLRSQTGRLDCPMRCGTPFRVGLPREGGGAQFQRLLAFQWELEPAQPAGHRPDWRSGGGQGDVRQGQSRMARDRRGRSPRTAI